ncbi:MAG: hypothetical protein ABIR98_10500 [Usitatibacter sp.]
MKSNLRRYAAAFLTAIGFAMPASATSFGTDYTDLWFNPAESGWGVNVIQQSGTLFATLFVYGADNTPRWYVASDLRGGQNSFTGLLYQTFGPAFSATWTGSATVTQVGSMTFTFSSFSTGTLSYTVNGVTVNKAIQRQTFAGNNMAGNYIGGMTAVASSCASSADNGFALITGLLTVAHGSGNPSMRVDFRNNAGVSAQCTFTGPYSAAGRLASITGTFTCTLGSNGTFTMTEVDVSRNGFTAAFTGRDQFCTYNGFFGGIRDVI